MKKFSSLGLILSTITLLLSSGFGRAGQVVSNLGESSSGSMTFSGNNWLAASFTTDNLEYTLNSVTLSLDSPLSSSVTVTLRIFADGSGAPTGSALETFTPVTFSSGGNKTFSSTGLDLNANSTYWLAASGTGSIPVWFATTSTVQTGNWTIGDNGLTSNNGGGNWTTSPNIGKFSIDASPVPEPAPAALMLLAMGCFAVFRFRKIAKRP